MKRITLWCGAVALVVLLAVGSAAAKPKAKPKLKAATFQLEIKGEQLTTWKYTKAMAPSCDWPEGASGRQYIEFGTYKTGDSARPKVKAKPVPGGGVELKLLRKNITLTADADLKRSQDVLYSQMSPCPGGGDSGGGTEGKTPDVHDQARCTALGDLDLFLGKSIEEVEHESYPTELADSKPPKAPLYFAADPFWVNSTSSDSNLPSACVASGMPNADIGIAESQGEWAGALIPVAGSLPAAKLLKGKRKVTVVELGRTVKYPNAVQSWAGPEHTTGSTRIDLTLTFKRLR
jgi:hypothetical protein